MKTLTQYIHESYDKWFKLSPNDKKLLLELDRRLDVLLTKFGKEQIHFAHVTNIKSEIERIQKSIDDDKDFNINLKYEDSKFGDKTWANNLINEFNELKHDFTELNTCYLTKFYTYKIDKIIDSIIFFRDYSEKKFMPETVRRPSRSVYLEAVKILTENEFIDVHALKDDIYKRNKDPEYSRKRLQGIIDKHGYGWEVVIDDNMIPRMSVMPYQKFFISRTNLFSEVDLQSLEVHEIEVHTARKYYSLQTGLYLFLHGLHGHDILDEGMAIYNSLNKTKNPKPNILFYISIKIVILYHMFSMSNLELFNYIRTLTNAPDRVIILAMIRASRVFSWKSSHTSSSDEDYLDGYLLVKQLSEKQREELLHYAIGPEQLHELDTIKKFLEVNKFKPIKFDIVQSQKHHDNDDTDTYYKEY